MVYSHFVEASDQSAADVLDGLVIQTPAARKEVGKPVVKRQSASRAKSKPKKASQKPVKKLSK
jgi:hypothetical protein